MHGTHTRTTSSLYLTCFHGSTLHLPGIVMARQMPFFVLEMENWAFLPEARNAPIDLTFQLYDKVLTLKRLYDQYGPRQKSALFKVESWFLLHVRRWLKTTAGETPEWVKNAIKQDEVGPCHRYAWTEKTDFPCTVVQIHQ